MALSLNISKINIQLDARLVVEMLSENAKDNALLNPILFECRNLLMRFPHKTIKHIYREANQCVDFLAKKGAKSQFPLTVLCSPSEDVYPSVVADIVGVSYPRFVATNQVNVPGVCETSVTSMFSF